MVAVFFWLTMAILEEKKRGFLKKIAKLFKIKLGLSRPLFLI
jgi:hypothetical protein